VECGNLANGRIEFRVEPKIKPEMAGLARLFAR